MAEEAAGNEKDDSGDSAQYRDSREERGERGRKITCSIARTYLAENKRSKHRTFQMKPERIKVFYQPD